MITLAIMKGKYHLVIGMVQIREENTLYVYPITGDKLQSALERLESQLTSNSKILSGKNGNVAGTSVILSANDVSRIKGEINVLKVALNIS